MKPEPEIVLVDVRDVRVALLAELSPARAEAVLGALLVRVGKKKSRANRLPRSRTPSNDVVVNALADLRKKGLVR